MDRTDAVALAAAAPAADQAAFGFKALKAAQAAEDDERRHAVEAGRHRCRASRRTPSRGALVSGRLTNTGIVLSLAADPRDRRSWHRLHRQRRRSVEDHRRRQDLHAAGHPGRPGRRRGRRPVSNPNIVVAATGQAFQGGGEGGALGAYVSRDAGKTWTRPTANVGGNGGQQVSISPNGTIFVATDRGLWRSTDHGGSFVNVQLPTNAAGTAPAREHPGRLLDQRRAGPSRQAQRGLRRGRLRRRQRAAPRRHRRGTGQRALQEHRGWGTRHLEAGRHLQPADRAGSRTPASRATRSAAPGWRSRRTATASTRWSPTPGCAAAGRSRTRPSRSASAAPPA